MPYSADQLEALDRLLNFWDGDLPYNPVTNPGGLKGTGYILNFERVFKDIAAVMKGAGGLAQDAQNTADQFQQTVADAVAAFGSIQGVADAVAQARAAAAQATAAVASGRVSYATLAQLNANLSPRDGAVGEVTDDGLNSGTYVKSGGAGTGFWAFFSADTLPALSARLARAQTQMLALFNSYAEEVEDRVGGVTADRQRDALVTRAEVIERVAAVTKAPVEAPRFGYQGTNDHKTDGRAFPVGRRKILFMPIMGQSLAIRGVTGNAFSTTPLSPLRGLMPASGLHIADSVRSPNWTGLREGLITDSDKVTNETSATSFVAHLNAIIDGISGTTTPDDKPIVATAICAIGAQNYWQLKEGSRAFRWFTIALTDLVEWAEPRGYEVECPAVLWVQGENDVFFTNGYDAMLDQLQRTLARAARAITGQREEPIVFFNQVNRVIAVQAQSQSHTGQRLQGAQLMAHRLNPRLRCVGPIYACEMGDMVHKSSRGAYSMGMLFARGVAAELFGLSEFAAGCRPLMPKVGFDGLEVFFITPTRIRINCHVPVEPMVIDTSGSIISTGSATYNDGTSTWTTDGIGSTLGFNVYNPDGTKAAISAVTLASGSTTAGDPPGLLLDLASAPAAPWVRVSYAENRDAVKGGPSNYTTATLDDGSPDGPKMGARGCIRDSAAHAALYDGALEYNWMVTWSRRVPVWSVNPGAFTA